MEQYRKVIAQAIAESSIIEQPEAELLLEFPPDSRLGDFAFPCFTLARRLKQPPNTIAGNLALQLEKNQLFSKVTAVGPYVNFTLSRPQLAREVLGEILAGEVEYGNSDTGQGKVVTIDFSSPNIARPFPLQLLRSTVIGAALGKIYRSQGYRVIGINHLGDWGTQFGKLIAAFRKWGDRDKLREKPVTHLIELYVRFRQEAEKDSGLEEKGRLWFKRLEEGHAEALELWREFRALSLEEFRRVYNLLGVEFEHFHGESFYNDKLDSVLSLLENKELLRKSQGALVVELGEEMPPCIIKKQDGATLYATRDISAAIYRQEQYQFDKMLYVVGADQSLHFRQVFAVLELMGFSWAENCVHVRFGLIRFKEGKMSTRQGKVVLLEDVLNKAVQLSLEIIQQKNPELEQKEKVARQVGIGAVIFADLVTDRIKDVEFEWEKILDFSGDTAPYIQYAHARICSILRKEHPRHQDIRGEMYTGREEEALLIALSRFPAALSRSLELDKPSVLARYLLDLARDFNQFYHACPVLQAEQETRDARLLLTMSVRVVLAKGLSLLGIAAPEEM